MSAAVEYRSNTAAAAQIAAHLAHCDADFVPPLSGRVEITAYANKIAEQATRFEAWSGATLVGLVAVYCNDMERRIAYITSVSVLKQWRGKGIATRLLHQCLAHAQEAGMRQIRLETTGNRRLSNRLYERVGFVASQTDTAFLGIKLSWQTGQSMNDKRDYNVEILDTHDHRYAYNFDFEVMHPFMLKAFTPFFNPGSLLELGSCKGDFTKRLLPHFTDLTCVEASEVAIAEARQRLGDQVQFVKARFEEATLPKRYDNIVLTHVLEHLDNPVQLLKRINDEWLAEGGRFFLVCPNANAPSRQIAVKMGLISHNTAVTKAEAAHGHRRTYTLDTLEHDAISAGLQVVHRSGIFFKALANFQWDRLLQTDIISREYLEGCYKLGQEYPDLCASIFLLCERGH